jgi:hypothetical protein
MSTHWRHYAVLAVAAVILSSGSAYAGGAIARNSVGSPQVRDNSLRTADVKNDTIRSIDVRDRALRRPDLALGQVPRTYTVIRSVPSGTTQVLNIPGFSRFSVSCSPSSVGLTIQFGDADPTPSDPTQQHGLAGSDIADNNPTGGVTITGFGGGVGFTTGAGSPPSSGILVRGDYWGRSRNLLAHGTWAWGFPSVPCLFRLQLVVQELPTPVPVARVAPGQRRASGVTCERSGGSGAFCLEP